MTTRDPKFYLCSNTEYTYSVFVNDCIVVDISLGDKGYERTLVSEQILGKVEPRVNYIETRHGYDEDDNFFVDYYETEMESTRKQRELLIDYGNSIIDNAIEMARAKIKKLSPEEKYAVNPFVWEEYRFDGRKLARVFYTEDGVRKCREYYMSEYVDE